MFATKKLELEDRLRYSFFIRKLFRKLNEFRAKFTSDTDQRLRFLFSATNMLTDPKDDTVSGQIHSALAQKSDLLGWLKNWYSESETEISKGILIKPYVSEHEKGVIYVDFEKHLVRLLNSSDFEKFQKQFIIIFAPSWSPPHSPALYAMPRLLEDGLFTTISNIKDIAFMENISDRLHKLERYASSWVNTDNFKTKPNDEKDIDLLVIANFGKFKRHFSLFKALSEMATPIKVTLIGQDEPGRMIESVIKEAKLYGVEHMIDFAGPKNYEQISEYLSRAKTTAIFSKREGSCVVIAESIAANTPTAVFADAEIGSKAFINEHTGILLDDKGLCDQLFRFIAQSEQFNPKQWLLDSRNDCKGSAVYLNEKLRDWHLRRNRPWTQDIFVMERSPLAKISKPNEQQQMLAEQARIEREFGLFIGRR